MSSKRMSNWLEKYSLLEEYYNEHGNIDVPQTYSIDGVNLGLWLSRQRLAYNGNSNHKITKEQIELLNKLGMKWDIRKVQWNECYSLLVEYYNEYGNIDVPNSYIVNGIRLGSWLHTQRQSYKGKGTFKITEEEINLLNKLGMKWSLISISWYEYYKLLKEYYNEHGNIDVPAFYEVNNIKLRNWLTNQKKAYKGEKNRNITKEQIALLNTLDIDWSVRETKFLNSIINDENSEKYNVVLLSRLKHVLDDMIYEGFNEIDDSFAQDNIEDEIVKRLWR